MRNLRVLRKSVMTILNNGLLYIKENKKYMDNIICCRLFLEINNELEDVIDIASAKTLDNTNLLKLFWYSFKLDYAENNDDRLVVVKHNRINHTFEELRLAKVNDLEKVILKLKKYYNKRLSFDSPKVRKQIKEENFKKKHKKNVKQIKENHSTLFDIFS